MKKISQQNSLSVAQCEMPAEQIPEIIRYPITVGRNVRRPDDITVRDISYIMDAIQTGFYEGYNLKKAIEVIRNMTDKEAQRNAKSTLPWFCGSLMHTKRANANVKQASFMVFDLDHVGVANSDLPQPLSVESLQPSLVSKLSPSFEAARTTHGSQPTPPSPFVVHSALNQKANLNQTLAESTPNLQGQAIEDMKALAVTKLPYIRYAMRSVVDGVKLVAQFTKPITSEEVYRRVYIFLALQIEWAVKHICDATPDWARACYMSYDPELIINHNCQPLDAQVCYKQAISVMEIPFPGGRAAVGTDILSVHADGTSAATLSVESFQPSPITKLSPNSAAERTTRDSRLSQPSPFVVHSAAEQETSINQTKAESTPNLTSDYAKAEAVINTMSQIPIVYKDWVKLGQALYAGFGERGKALWDMFINNPNYKDSQVMMDAHWRSFRSTHSVTLASLFYLAEKYGVRYE